MSKTTPDTEKKLHALLEKIYASTPRSMNLTGIDTRTGKTMKVGEWIAAQRAKP
jgi:hypothetical protein